MLAQASRGGGLAGDGLRVGTGHISGPELKPLADFLGFGGGEAQWALEFASACRYLGCDPNLGIDCQAFKRFLSDTSHRGCFCTEAELRTMLRRFMRVHFVIDYERSFDCSSDSSDMSGDCDLWDSLALRKGWTIPDVEWQDEEPTVDCRACGVLRAGTGKGFIQDCEAHSFTRL